MGKTRLRTLVIWCAIALFLLLLPGCSVYFPDANLKSGIENTLNVSPLTTSDMLKLTQLKINRGGIVNLAGLEYSKNLTHLNLCRNRISDISVLSSLMNLESLELGRNQIRDISALSKSNKLTYLNLRVNQIRDISPIVKLKNLEYLSLFGNPISDISPLSSLTNLKTLRLYNNKVRDISPLSGLTNMRKLLLFSNSISDISALSNLSNLWDLELYNNQIRDISVMSLFTNVVYLRLQNNQINDISPLSDLRKLKKLNLLDNPLDESAYSTYIPMIEANNPGIELRYDPQTTPSLKSHYDPEAALSEEIGKKGKALFGKPEEVKAETPEETMITIPPEKEVAEVLGKKITSKDINISSEMVERKRDEMDPAKFSQWYNSRLESQIRSVIFRPLLGQYVKDRNIEVTDAEIRAFISKVREIMTKQEMKWEEQRAQLVKDMQSVNLTKAEKDKITSKLETIERILDSQKKQEQRRKEDEAKHQKIHEDVAKISIRAWKVNKALFDKYGGRVIFQQAGPEPLDAYREFLKEQEAKGVFQIMDENLTPLFWNYFTNDKMHTFYSDEDEAAKMMATPWWLHEEDAKN